MKTVGVAILGLGVVGGGTYRILTENHDRIAKTQNLDVRVEAVLEINRDRALQLGVPAEKITANIAEVVGNPNVDIVVEVIGGIEPALSFITTALKNGKTVVTANKELVSKHWAELEGYAKHNHAGLYFEASCVGGVPIIRTLIDGMQANRVQSMVGIINGTTNYILTKMTKEGIDYETALKEAQACGFAEANPTADVDGYDASYKLSILSSLAFSEKIPLERVYREGIRNVSAVDIRLGAELGYTLKLLAIARMTEKGAEAHVHPAFVPLNHPLASVDGSFNAVLLHGDMVDDVMLYGRGAGSLPTGSAIVSDICYAAGKTEHWYAPFHNTDNPSTCQPVNDDFESEYYVRLNVADELGVLSEVSGVFGRHGVSLNEVLQRGEQAQDGGVTVIFITHKTGEHCMKQAITDLKRLSSVHGVESLIRVEAQ